MLYITTVNTVNLSSYRKRIVFYFFNFASYEIGDVTKLYCYGSHFTMYVVKSFTP